MLKVSNSPRKMVNKVTMRNDDLNHSRPWFLVHSPTFETIDAHHKSFVKGFLGLRIQRFYLFFEAISVKELHILQLIL